MSDAHESKASWFARHAKSPSLWLGLISASIVLMVAVVDSGRTSPGPLAAVHEREADLAGPSGCAECHGGFTTGMTSSCLDCHGLIEDQIDARQGLHGALTKGEVSRCATCHSDHHGAGFAIVNQASFSKAGIGDWREFEHDFVGFAMDGAHLELDCTECHEHAETAVLPEGGLRFGGLVQDCASCHEDPHEGALSALSCVDCHSQGDFLEIHSTGHAQHLPLVGGHAALDCRECHAEGDAHSLESLASTPGRKLPKNQHRACTSCHESPHDQGFVNRNAKLAGLAVNASCVKCHEHEHMSFADEALELSNAQHARSGFKLILPHDDVSCEACHDPELAKFEQRYPGRAPESCSACHADVHEGQFAKGPFGGQECTACHEPERFEPHAFTLELHAQTSLPLDGVHAESECSDCHEKPLESAPRTFNGTSDTCSVCHGDAHSGFFDKRAAELQPVEHGDCARCHGTDSFANEINSSDPATGFDHHHWTAFPILGAHTQESCESCHPRADEPDEFGRTLGRVQEHFGFVHAGGNACTTCHTDPHEGRFDGDLSERTALPVEVDGRTGCVRCHDESSFRALPYGFDHGLWTDFVLDGAHASNDCSACHTPLRRPDAVGRTWGHAKGTSCADCHADPHAGQFDMHRNAVGAIDCASCHASTETFARLGFDHNWDSRFRLDETHVALECAQCHETESINGVDTVRYRPLGMDCTDCHGIQGGTLKKQQMRDKR